MSTDDIIMHSDSASIVSVLRVVTVCPSHSLVLDLAKEAVGGLFSMIAICDIAIIIACMLHY